MLPDQDNPGLDDMMLSLEYPTGVWHLIKILAGTDDKKMLSMSNPDGYFYITYLKTCLKFFTLATLLCFFPLSQFYLNASNSNSLDSIKNTSNLSFI